MLTKPLLVPTQHRSAHTRSAKRFAADIAATLEFAGDSYSRTRCAARVRSEVRQTRYARTILDACTAQPTKHEFDARTGIVGRVAREHGMQILLIDLLCEYGADANAAMRAALGHGEWKAVETLCAEERRSICRGCGDWPSRGCSAERCRRPTRSLTPCACMGGTIRSHRYRSHAARLRRGSKSLQPRRNSLAFHAAASGRLGWPCGCCQASVERGARLDIPDIHHQGTPLQWAEMTPAARRSPNIFVAFVTFVAEPLRDLRG